MNKYIVAYISQFEHVLYQQPVWSTSERQAMLEYLAQYQDIVFDEQELLSMESVDQVIECCRNMDSNISVYSID
jgi:hypothetical protein